MLHAILEAADLCVTEPAVVARRRVDTGFTDRTRPAKGDLGSCIEVGAYSRILSTGEPRVGPGMTADAKGGFR